MRNMVTDKIPRHVAIIMDGNGRWAKEHGLSRMEGHQRGAEVIEKIVTECQKRGVKFLTLYAFSEENWMRPSEEVSSLMELLRLFIRLKREKMVKKGVRFLTIGDLARFSPDIQQELDQTIEATATCQGMTLVLALSYGGRQEICRAVNSLLAKGVNSISPDDFASALDTAHIPDPDLLIRTSGECRISNFLLWQLAYTELYFTETLWPDFSEKTLDEALYSYSKRERRFGLVSEQVISA